MPGITVHFLLVYSFADRKLIKCAEFKERRAATDAYAAMETKYQGRSDEFEVVLVGADSIETIMKTHGHYFADADDSLFSEYLLETH